MDRFTVVMRQENLGFLLLSLKELRTALTCPEKTRGKAPGQLTL